MKSFFLLIIGSRNSSFACLKKCSKRDYPSDKTNGLSNKKTRTYRFLLILALIMMQPFWSDICYEDGRIYIKLNKKGNKNKIK